MAACILFMMLSSMLTELHALHIMNPPPNADGNDLPVFINSPMFIYGACTNFNVTLPVYAIPSSVDPCVFSPQEKDVRGNFT